MIIEVRNPVWVGDNAIDCEAKSDVFGWIPYAAMKNDVSEAGRNLYARIVAGEFGEVAPQEVPEDESNDDGSSAGGADGGENE